MQDTNLKTLEYTSIIDLLAEKCTSIIGKNIAKNLKPIKNLQKIKGMQEESSEAQSILLKRGEPPLHGIHDVLTLVRKTEIGSYLDPGELLYLKSTLSVARQLKQFIKEMEAEDLVHPIIDKLITDLHTLKEIEDKIETCILNEKEISDNASRELRNIRRKMNSKNDGIRNKLNSIINSTSYQKYLQDPIVTIRHDRYVVPVKQEFRGQFPGLIHDQSSSGATLFIEPISVVELNNELKELKLKERREIERILLEISGLIGEKGELIKDNQKNLAEIDFIFAKGKLSIDMKAIEPKLNQEGKVKIINGRHPLLKVEEVVPISIWLGEDFKLLIITGPNTGGKTVTLKTIGLFCLMAQSGLHLPADYGTELPIFDKIFADIGDEQSIEQNLSTFSSHMTNIVDILDEVTGDSLVLLDELGAGTDPTEGAALAMAILNHLKELGVSVVATTHYSELKQYALINEGVENASVEFDIKSLAPTYRVLIGVPGKSNAFEISQKLGLSRKLIKNAQSLLTTESINFEALLSNIEENRLASEEDRRQAESLKLESQDILDKYYKKKEKVEAQRKKIIGKAKAEALTILQEAKKESEEIIKGLRKLKLDADRGAVNKEIEEARRHLAKGMDNLSPDLSQHIFPTTSSKPPKNLKKGDLVRIVSMDQSGYVINPPNDRGEVFVQVGIMKINIPVTNLERIKEDEKPKQKAFAKLVRSKASNVKNELDIRGLNLEESFMEVDKYLDDVYLSGLTEVTIIHGIGTGVLRAGIKQMLNKHRHVEKFREGRYGEGGAGVTIVNIK